MKITKNNAVIGAKVKLVTRNWGDYKSNPVWDGAYGRVQGEITGSDGRWIHVNWSNGDSNSYYDNDLEQIQVPAMKDDTAKTETAKVEVKIELKASTLHVPSATLAALVAEKILDNQSEKKDFSAYDITKSIRQDVNDKKVSVHGVSYEDVNGMNTQRIEHSDVRTLVSEALKSNKNYTRENTRGGYILYKFVETPAAPAPVAAVAPAVTYTPTGTTTTSVPPQVGATSSVLTKEKLYAYLDGGAATLKQIQSRFKVRGAPQPTIAEIESFAKSCGYYIDKVTPHYKSVVTV